MSKDQDDLAREIQSLSAAETVQRLENLLISRATGGTESDDEYRALRRKLLSNPPQAGVPDFVRSSRTLAEFWTHIKQLRTYASRRASISDAFAPLHDELDGLANSAYAVAPADASGAGPPRPGFWARLDTPVKVIGGIVGAIVLVAGVVFTIYNPFSGNPQDAVAIREPPAVAAYKVASCEKHHAMRAAHTTTGLPYGRHMTFSSCQWPPTGYTDANGFLRITDSVSLLPRTNSAPYNTVDQFTATCGRLGVTYLENQMLRRDFVANTILVNRIYRIIYRKSGAIALKLLDHIPYDIPDNVISVVPNTSTFYVLHSGHTALFAARCVS